ncbi:DUF2793 domain-containing protein [Tsuneonella sp. YG55]|uniref:DUF2793 domain-containing protein n=1 Tax=Tsuneonella litorea TaxID=2976475 RepID=A0A9X2VZD8_9SPHN|nr:DUF2793 domain-containing protein [Tsuneonella litorea]MCT2557654.1 DUF2793 domain-containing protein [Tsuneonella litorea]
MHPAVEGEAGAPPIDPPEGECWLVAAGATGAFAGQEGNLAIRQSGEWVFVAARDGTRIYDRATGQFLLFNGAWQRESAIAAPAGGQTIDTEARAAIGELIGALTRCGILPRN